MKITKVEAIELRTPETESPAAKPTPLDEAILVKIHTDEGITGVGDALSSPRMVKALIEAPFSAASISGLGRLLIGMNPLDIRVINDMLLVKNDRQRQRGLLWHAIAAIDIALWDIAGKYYNQPVYQLLGGAFHKKFRAIGTVLFGPDGKTTYERAKWCTGKGLTAVKFAWAGRSFLGQSEKLDFELIEAAQSGVGDNKDIVIDAGLCWDTNTAIKRVQQLKDYRVLYIEDPLERENLDGYQRLTAISPIPIAAGEYESGRFAWRNLLERSGIGIAMINVEAQGFTEAMRVADMAEDRSIRVINFHRTGGIGLAAALHFLASRRSAFMMEYCVDETPIRLGLTKHRIPVIDGFVQVLDKPGLGVELNEETVERYKVG